MLLTIIYYNNYLSIFYKIINLFYQNFQIY